MLLEQGEFIKNIESGEIHWITRVDLRTNCITIAKQVTMYEKEYFVVSKEDFYEKYMDVRG